MAGLVADLDLRVNPERSRNFSATEFEAGLARLTEQARQIEAQFADFRPMRIALIGTNGKGSTAFALEQCFRAGMAHRSGALPLTGLYTSPHLQQFNERIRLNGVPAPLPLLESEHRSLKQFLPPECFAELTYFELLTLLAFRLFQSRGIPVQIFEAGLGGRLDATRIANPDAVLLTHVGLDHTSLLGHTRRQILREKLGIMGSRTRVIYVADPRLESAVHAELSSNPSLASFAPEVVCLPAHGIDKSYLNLAAGFARFVYENIRERLLSSAYFTEAAAEPAEPFPHEPPEPRGSIEPAFAIRPLLERLPGDFAPLPPPGRFEVREGAHRTFIFDNGHNPAAVFRFLSDFQMRFPAGQGRTGIILALLQDRRTAPLRRVLGLFSPGPILQICREGFAPPDPAWHSLKASPEELVPLIQAALENGPLVDCRFILFVGSHRLYDLFDTVSRGDTPARTSTPS